MKQITLKELKEILRCVSNNDFANTISIFMDATSEDALHRGCSEYAELLRKRSNDIYYKLQELGYYDE